MSVDDYKILQIADAVKCVSMRVSIIGVAAETTLPKSTKGSDYFCSVRIIDESQPNGIEVHFFAEAMKKLPSVQSVGNIVVLSRVVISLDFNALFNEQFSTFAIFEGRGSIVKELVPYQTSAIYKPSDHDNTQVMRLRKWPFGDKIEVLHESLFLGEIRQGDVVDSGFPESGGGKRVEEEMEIRAGDLGIEGGGEERGGRRVDC